MNTHADALRRPQVDSVRQVCGGRKPPPLLSPMGGGGGAAAGAVATTGFSPSRPQSPSRLSFAADAPSSPDASPHAASALRPGTPGGGSRRGSRASVGDEDRISAAAAADRPQTPSKDAKKGGSGKNTPDGAGTPKGGKRRRSSFGGSSGKFRFSFAKDDSDDEVRGGRPQERTAFLSPFGARARGGRGSAEERPVGQRIFP